MSIMFAALNPNISSEQLCELIEHDTKLKIDTIKVFGECLRKMETDKDKEYYLQKCLPVLMNFIFI